MTHHARAQAATSGAVMPGSDPWRAVGSPVDLSWFKTSRFGPDRHPAPQPARGTRCSGRAARGIMPQPPAPVAPLSPKRDLAMRIGQVLLGLIALGASALFGLSHADVRERFRIGTGATGGTYYPIGGMIANAISNPSGEARCPKTDVICGVKGLTAVAVTSAGSVENVRAVNDALIESAFAQADITYWAFRGTGIFDGQPPLANLRAVANLFPESMHLVVRRDARVRSVVDLRGRRVSLDQPGSGTLVNARVVLTAFGLKESDVKAEYIAAAVAADKLVRNELDAFFLVAGAPVRTVADLAANTGLIELVPIIGAPAEAVIAKQPFFRATTIPADTYDGIETVASIGVGAQWIVGAQVDADLIYEITAALWNPLSLSAPASIHKRAGFLSPERALIGIAIPLHPGAERFYREQGLLK
ncbi:MAG: TAXI family TRAP transporter solute-binding subunit [Alphaproteobacteria bacterium]|nr:TAXI family TRAP transporter solute-binding subunit [Alphaproteobacteria bacterium]